MLVVFKAPERPSPFTSISELIQLDHHNLTAGCGAFIHGMEDEYSTVRSNTVQAMCNLSTSCPEFGVESMSHLVDMLNDEIQGVRLLAIRSLRQISEVRRLTLSWLML